MRQYYPNNSYRRRIPSFLVLVAILFGGWWFFGRPKNVPLPPPQPPRAITARGDLASDEQNTIELFRAASPSVVYITNIALRRNLFNLNVDEIPKGTGSGFVWDKEGRIVTNFHVIEDANSVEVTLADHTTWKASLVGVAPDKDLAVLQIDAPAAALAPLAIGESHNLLVGQKVFAIGNPFGLDQTITAGIVSALGREIQAVTGRTIQGVIQTDAAINPGNSGGPLLDSAGRLIGVNTAIYSPSGGSSGIGFAVPVDEVSRAVPEIISYGRVIRPGLGVTLASESITHRLGINGMLIIKVREGSSAAKIGLRGIRQSGNEIIIGDVITGVNGVVVSSYDDLRNELDRHRVGEEIEIEILREEKTIRMRVTLEEVA
ncbi:MAG: trypsin-like peptidase domain-containing protein [Desulfobulbaceae bacterium]|nr:trypsin-like peptidase domain-containing protein [Desulfobulbaceae bacterium]